MSNASQQIVNKAWNFAHVLRDDGLSYMAYTEQRGRSGIESQGVNSCLEGVSAGYQQHEKGEG